MTFLVIATAALFVLAMLFGGPAQQAQTEQQQVDTAQTGDAPSNSDDASADASADDGETSPTDAEIVDADADANPVDAPPAAAPQTTAAPASGDEGALSLEGLHPMPVTQTLEKQTELGSLDHDATEFLMRVYLSRYGAGVSQIDFSTHFTRASNGVPYTVLSAPKFNGQVHSYPFAVKSLEINGNKPIRLDGSPWELIETTDTTAHYSIVIANDADQPIVRIDRIWHLETSTYDLECEQSVTNLTDQKLRFKWVQYGQSDVPPDEDAYLGDRREIVTGYFDPSYDKRKVVYVDDAMLGRHDVVDELQDNQQIVWPNEDVDPQAQLVWLGTVNRYFTAVVHRPLAGDPAAAQRLDTAFSDVNIVPLNSLRSDYNDIEVMVELTTAAMAIEPGDTVKLDLGLYVGPRDPAYFETHSPSRELGLSNLVVYSLGCFCTFQWLAEFLLWFLETLHDYVTYDWAISIIILVLVVRLCLHPLTKSFQSKSLRVSKRMAALQPELAELKKKYADDPAKMGQEQMRLWREHGINPASMVGYGCVPALIQMPIWIALYAMLYFTIELRHEPAFYGLFQSISGGQWQFLGDLSSPDRFIVFSDEPLIFKFIIITFDFSSLNILPLLMGFFMYFQQKLMSPPAATPEQEQQQKMMRIMTIFLFPFMMYSVPSGLTLYILASSCAGVVDSIIVRRHVKKLEEEGRLFEKKEHKPGSFGYWWHQKVDSFMSRMGEIQAQAQEAQQAQQGGKGAAGKGAGSKGKGKGSRGKKR